MRTQFGTILAAVVAASFHGAAAYSSNLEDLTVARDATVAIDAVSYYGNATVHGTLNVNENLYLVTNDNALAYTTLAVGPDAGDNARVEIAVNTTTEDRLANSDRYTLRTVIGANGGCGTVVLNRSARLRGLSFAVAADATCANEVMDVLEFGVLLVQDENNPPSQETWTFLERYFSQSQPLPKSDHGPELVNACFAEKSITWNACSKLHRTELLQKAFRFYQGEWICMEEDMLLTLMVLCQAERYVRKGMKLYITVWDILLLDIIKVLLV